MRCSGYEMSSFQAQRMIFSSLLLKPESQRNSRDLGIHEFVPSAPQKGKGEGRGGSGIVPCPASLVSWQTVLWDSGSDCGLCACSLLIFYTF